MKQLYYLFFLSVIAMDITGCGKVQHSLSENNAQEANHAVKKETNAKEEMSNKNDLNLSPPDRELDLSLLHQNKNGTETDSRDYFSEKVDNANNISIDAKPNFAAPEKIGDLPELDGGNIELKMELE